MKTTKKLNDYDRLTIQILHKQGKSLRTLAKIYGVSPSTIQRICKESDK